MNTVFRDAAGAEAIRRITLARYAASGFASREVPTSFGPTHLLEAGAPDAPPVVLLHGTASNAMAWLGEIGPLSARFRVLAPDMPGEPGLSADRRLSLAKREPQAWLAELLAALGVSRCALVGTSLGGWAALGYATAAPASVSCLVLVSPSGLAPARASFLLKALPLMLLGKRGAAQINRMIFQSAPVPAEVAEFGALTAKSFKPVVEPVPVYSDEELAPLANLPLLYVAGGRDVLLRTQASAERLARVLPQAQIDVRPEAGHAVMDAGPAIRRFLDTKTAAEPKPAAVSG